MYEAIVILTLVLMAPAVLRGVDRLEKWAQESYDRSIERNIDRERAERLRKLHEGIEEIR